MIAHRCSRFNNGGEYRRLGEANARRSDFRLVAATNRDPAILKHDLLSALMDGLVRYPYATNTREIAVMLSAAMAQARGDVLGAPKEMRVPGVRRPSASDPTAGPKSERTADEVRAALDRASGNVSRAAAALGVSRQGLYRLFEKYGLKAK